MLKQQGSTRPEHFRPISLCNVANNVCAKVLLNRLRPIIKDVISYNKKCFCTGKETSIIINILIANELLSTIRRKKKGKAALDSLKLDMSKAYDTVAWHFIEAILIRMGFPNHLIQLIKKCITTFSFQFTINGALIGAWNPMRRIQILYLHIC